MASVGRNGPCPCGSGRKFKHCCLRAQEIEDGLRLRLRSAEGALVPALFDYATRAFGDDFFDAAWAEFFLWNDAGEIPDESREMGTTFDPFFVFSFVADDAEGPLPEHWPAEPVALHFLRHEAESPSALHREFIERACESPASFFAVETIMPGRSLGLKDIFTGRRFHVLEQTASRTLRAGDVTFTRVVTAGGGSIMVGASPWVIPASWHIPLIDVRERLGRGGLMTRADLLDFDMEIREVYLGIVDALLNPAPPEMRNTDGDPLELTTLTYELAVTAAEAVTWLTPLATLKGDVHVSDEAHDAAGALDAATLTWIKPGNRQHQDWDNTALGTLRVDGSRLVVEINSARRRQRIKSEITRRLGSAATLVDTTVADLAETLAQRGSGSGMPPDGETPDAAPTPAELRALEVEMARRHWDTWPDIKLPALGNKTPRQAAKSASGRERLEALLADFAQMGGGRSDAFAPDVPALRRTLGLA